MTFLPTNQTVEIGTATTVLEVAQKHKIALHHECGGMGSCTTCLVRIFSTPTEVSDRTEVEQEMATMKGFEAAERLACQLVAAHGLVVEICSESL
jgi:ferredoxin